MPAMPRLDGKGKKIAYALLGTPSNIKDKKTARQKEIDAKLYQQDTSRVR